MLEKEELIRIISELALDHDGSNVHRCVAGRHINSLASTRGSMLADNRYTRADRFPALYTSYYDYLAIREVTQQRIYQEALPGAGTVSNFTFSVRVNCDGVLDLMQPEIQSALGTNLQELTGEWKLLNELNLDAPTQILGQAAFESGVVKAIRYPSKIEPHRANLVIFKDRIGHPLVPLNLPPNFPPQEPL